MVKLQSSLRHYAKRSYELILKTMLIPNWKPKTRESVFLFVAYTPEISDQRK